MEGSEVIELTTKSPLTYREILAGDPSVPVERIRGYLFLPPGHHGVLPVVAIIIGSLGFTAGREELYSRALNAVGIAAFVVDSFAPRGFAETVSNQGRLSSASQASDALHAIALLQKDPRFDPRRVGILGFSRGGQVAVATQDQRLQNAVLGRDHGIAAHVALYPSLNPRWRDPLPTKARMLMLLGGADERAPEAKAQHYAKQFAAAGGSVDVVVFPGLFHSFDSLMQAKWRTEANLSRCQMLIEDDGSIVEETSGIRPEGSWGEFLGRLQSQCGSVGGTVGSGPAPRDIAVKPIQAFLTKELGGLQAGVSTH